MLSLIGSGYKRGEWPDEKQIIMYCLSGLDLSTSGIYIPYVAEKQNKEYMGEGR